MRAWVAATHNVGAAKEADVPMVQIPVTRIRAVAWLTAGLCAAGTGACSEEPTPSTEASVFGPAAVQTPTGGGAAPTASPAAINGPTTQLPVGSQPTTAAEPPATAGPTIESPMGSGAENMPVEPTDLTHRCGWGEPVDARDLMIDADYQVWNGNLGEIDLFLPQPVLDWMEERVWEGSHNLWHAVRQCEVTSTRRFGRPRNAVCDERPALVAENQNCENARDGFEFMLMHRHMIQSLRQAFPGHAQLFAGFPAFPFSADDVPEPLRPAWGRGWSAAMIETATMLDDIENNLDQFPTEGDLGMFMQCGAMSAGGTGIHGALHFKWAQFTSPHNLGDQSKDLGNYMFWKLHGWMDDVWQRYRVAKGLDTDPTDKIEEELEDQCWEMHDLGHVAVSLGQAGDVELPEESGVFHETIRPILDAHCSSCHSGSTPSGGLVLGGAISSAELVASLVDQPAARGGSFMLVRTGQPQASWLYLRASDMAKTAGCTGTCSTGVMPPTGEVTLTTSELATIAQWITDGAPGPDL